mmetsp:Transcript_23593/g.44844  ORF Transcript_23593/g.44844 Transcript_23593/m.44844 type:complete len:288 (+) Transcript_23593:341-1204(+)
MSKSNSEHPVINLLVAILMKHSPRVKLPIESARRHRNAHRLNGDSTLQRLLRLADVHVLLYLGRMQRRTLGHFTLTSPEPMTVVRVRIVVQCAEAHGVLSVVGEGVVHESSAAAEVGLVAVDELLDGEFGEVAGLDVARSFDGSDGAECPAGSAEPLVLHLGHGTLLVPILVLGNVILHRYLRHLYHLVLNLLRLIAAQQLPLGTTNPTPVVRTLRRRHARTVLPQVKSPSEFVVRHVRKIVVRQSMTMTMTRTRMTRPRTATASLLVVTNRVVVVSFDALVIGQPD